MASIVKRKRKDGTWAYRAQIRIMVDGEPVYQETKTFDRQAAAAGWADKREEELSKPGALEALQHKPTDRTLAEIINQYITDVGAVKPLGETKTRTLNAIARSWLGARHASTLVSQDYVEYASRRITEDGIEPQTVGNDISFIGSVVGVAEPAWKDPLSYEELAKAKRVMKKMGLIRRSRQRTRRPTLEELDLILKFFTERRKPRANGVDMPKVTVFALFSTRRLGEICRITWPDLIPERQSVIVRDMKNPGEKEGNDVECYLPDEAWRVVQSMEKREGDDRIFPYHEDTIGRAWTDVVMMCGIDDLHFHDLRHEGVSRLFEMDWDIPRVSSVSGHRDWSSLKRYTHLRGRGDKFKGWPWLARVLGNNVVPFRAAVG